MNRTRPTHQAPFRRMSHLFLLAVLPMLTTCTLEPDNREPTAAFTVTPSVGTIDTLFVFDASGCSDPEEECRFLQVRWDWNGDGVWDTMWGAGKRREHRYQDLGTFAVGLQVRDSWGATAFTVQETSVYGSLVPPEARLTVQPTHGTTDTLFLFDAGASENRNGANNLLTGHWDWEGDGEWDTDWSTALTQTHSFDTIGQYRVILEVRDNRSLTDTTSVSVLVHPSNTPPDAVLTVAPLSGTCETYFQYNAGGSTDDIDPVSDLLVRWDWENDGIWDTTWSTEKLRSHRFDLSGTVTTRIEVQDSYTATDTTSVQVTISNTAPQAAFTVNPTMGWPTTVFRFDPSGTTDAESPLERLTFRWDWEQDGTWDTEWRSDTPLVEHSFPATGEYAVTMEARDPAGASDTTATSVTVISSMFLGSELDLPVTVNDRSVAIRNSGEYVAADSGTGLHLYAPDGVLITSAVLPGLPKTAPVIAWDGRVYIGTTDGYLVAYDHALNHAWTFDTGSRNHGIAACPAIGPDGTLYVAAQNDTLFAVDADGQRSWARYIPGYVDGAVVYTPAGLVVVATRSFGVRAHDPSSGTLVWSRTLTGNVVGPPAVGPDGSIYIATSTGLVTAIYPNGTLRWSASAGRPLAQTGPAVGPDGRVYVGSTSGYLVCLAPDGQVLWEHFTLDEVRNTPVIADDGTIYCGTMGGYVFAVDEGGQGLGHISIGLAVTAPLNMTSQGGLFVGTASPHLYRIGTRSNGLATSGWPRFQHNALNMGRYYYP